jgi:MFS family permease
MPDATTDFRPLALLVGSAFFMEQLDSTIIAAAVPEIAKALGVAPSSLDTSITVYLLCSVVFIPLSGLLAGKLGTRTTFRLSLLVFVLSSAVCGCASSLSMLIAARAAQGFSHRRAAAGTGALAVAFIGASLLYVLFARCSTQAGGELTGRAPHNG